MEDGQHLLFLLLLLLHLFLLPPHASSFIIPLRLKRLAARFHGPICQGAIAAENASLWAGLCGSTVGALCVFPGGSQDGIIGTLPSSATITYIRNQKAGSEVLFHAISNRTTFNFTSTRKCYVGSTSVPKRRVGPNQHDPCFANAAERGESLLFTVVRDPIETALSAYLELRFRARYRDSKAGRVEFERLFANRNEKGDKSCNAAPNEPDATNDFLAYLDAVERGAALGREAFHAWPQALKIDRLQADNRRFDAIGRLENLWEDIAALRKAVLRNQASRAGFSSSLEQHRHSHSTASCGAVDLSDGRVTETLCRIYRVDYTCFGIPLPVACQMRRGRLYI